MTQFTVDRRAGVARLTGPGKVIERYGTGVLTIQLRYFEDQRERATSRTVTWHVRVD